MAINKTKENDASLPFTALQLLAPPARLVSAALWKVLKQRDVMQYGVVEEFVTSACQTVPKLLTSRHQGKLALGLRARLILELCRTQPDVQIISQHLERIRPPAAPSSSASFVKKDVKILKSVENFHSLVQTLLTDSAERERFFREQFTEEYGPDFDKELEKLLWEFLIRLDQLLPVPNLTQTVSWLSEAPSVLEECAQAATQPQLLKILLEHQSCLGHLESAASLPPNMGDSILTSLSLPPSGKTASTESSKPPSNPSRGQPADPSPFITPVIGLISNEEVPAMISASKKSLQADGSSASKDAANKPTNCSKFTSLKEKHTGDQGGGKDKNGERKRKQVDSDDEEVLTVSKKRGSRERDRGSNEEKREEEGCGREFLSARMSELGIRGLHHPGDPSIQSAFASCLSNQPRVDIRKLPCSLSTEGGWNLETETKNWRRNSTKKRTRSHETPDRPDLDDKENHPELWRSSSKMHRNTEMAGLFGVENDYVADSEDEGIKNFKGRLFTKRYYKTKHGTFVPTLREFWKPRATQRTASPGNRRR
ncbi:TERF1-interacting nuclear factor 2 [Oryzias melastigma]|uniref:TERF1 (TRF1)-interacting nuclear factor 2 n=1 Tax=Oryzias melastigma TaxID=30732 RepID=A0A3B3DLC7_ORYME|nr:TERF1-interacting nuclear factor 2 [Oryzias melastigma]